jgi:hypothetical protein
VSLLPLGGARSAQMFPVTRKLTFKGGELAPTGSMTGVKITRWPGSVFALEIEPGKLEDASPYSFPFTIAGINWLENVNATLFYENGLHLLIEDDSDKLLLGRTIETPARNGILLPRVSPKGEPLLFVHIDESQGERLLCVKGANKHFSIVFEHTAEGFTVSDNGRINCLKRLDTHLAHEQRSVYELDGDQYLLSSSEPARRTRRPITREDIVIAFIEAVKNRFENEAAGYLARDLCESIDFADIVEFIGEFEGWARPLYGTPVEENCVFIGICSEAAENILDARMFKFELDDASPPRIENFKEL